MSDDEISMSSVSREEFESDVDSDSDSDCGGERRGVCGGGEGDIGDIGEVGDIGDAGDVGGRGRPHIGGGDIDGDIEGEGDIDVEEEMLFSEGKEDDDYEAENEENVNGEPDPWVDDGFDDDLSQGSESGVIASSLFAQSSTTTRTTGTATATATTATTTTNSAIHGAHGATVTKKVHKQTNNYMTLYEFTKIIGVRSEQIMRGSQVLVKTSSTDPIEIAKEELRERVIPLKIRRTVPDRGTVRTEDWYVSEFLNIEVLLSFYDY